MIKKTIHHFRRGTIIAFETAAALCALLLLCWGALLLRLAHGPIDINFLTPAIEQAMSGQQPDFLFRFGRTELVWGGRLEPLELWMQAVEIDRKDGTPVLNVDRVGIQLSKRHLLFGGIVPRAITINGPAVRVMRQEDGRFTLNLSPNTDQAPTPSEDQPDFIKGILAELEERRMPLVGGLNKITITKAIVLYEDKLLKAAWKSRPSDIVFKRGTQGLSAEARVGLDLDAEHTLMLNVSAYHDWKKGGTNVLAGFSGLIPSLMAQGSLSLKDMSDISTPMKGGLALALDANFVPEMTRFKINADAGAFNVKSLYPSPIPVKSAAFAGTLNFKTHTGEIEQMRVDLGDAVAEGKASSKRVQGRTILETHATLSGMRIDDLKIFWPPRLAPHAQAWVTQHLSGGVASKATLDLVVSKDQMTESPITLDSVGGQIDFSGVKADYFPPLMPVLGVKGKAIYDQDSFHIDVTGGALGDMALKKSTVHITGLKILDDEISHAKIDIQTLLQGSLKTALQVLDSKPLGYLKQLGLQSDSASGKADVAVKLKFPLHHGLQLKDMEVSATGKLDDLAVAGLVANEAVTAGAVDFSFDRGSMNVKGTARLADVPVSFDWKRNFLPDAKEICRLTAKLPLTAAMAVKFSVPADFNVGGVAESDVLYTQTSPDQTTVRVKSDLTRAAFDAPFSGLKKAVGVPGTLDLTLHMKDGKTEKITDLSLQTKNISLKGDLVFDQGGVKSARLNPFIAGETDAAVTIAKTASGGYEIKMSGKAIDISSALSDNSKNGSGVQAALKVTPLTITLDARRIIAGKDKFLENAKILLRRNAWSRIEQMEIDGNAGSGALKLRYEPVAGGLGGHSLSVQAADAGAALSVLGVTDGVRKGVLNITSSPAPKSGPRDMAGVAILTDFTLIGAPALARILNAMSLPGIIELLNNKGIAFRKARANFFWTDRGPPDSSTNIRDIKITEGSTSGASLGLTFEGHINQWSNVYDLKGTIVPVSDLNNLISSIPLLGNLLTANGEGVFAATYTVKGSKSQPDVAVNPLAVLAPGILRKLFFSH